MQTCELAPPPAASQGHLPPPPGISQRHSAAHLCIGYHRLGRLVALAVGAFLLPWCAVLGATLPATAHAPNWPLAWMGLDAAEAVAALLTAVLLSRGNPRAGLSAAAGAALLIADAWFDVCTSLPGLDRALAVGEAVGVELPLAAAAIWFAVTLTRDVKDR